MIIIALNHPKQLEYLKGMFERHSQAGIPSGDLPLAADTFMAVMGAREVPIEPTLGKAEVVEAGPNGIALEVSGKSEN